jgi:hypothetical protein
VNLARLARPLLVPVLAAPVLLSSTLLFRRGKKATRADAFQDVFDALANVYAQAAALKDEWQVDWPQRAERPLPPKYAFGNASAEAAAADMRYGTALLQRNRWKSVVEPLFADLEPDRWARYDAEARYFSLTLLDVLEKHDELLLADERDWISAAIEQFDDVARRGNVPGQPFERKVAETTYGYVYAAIALSDRLIERLRFEASQRR